MPVGRHRLAAEEDISDQRRETGCGCRHPQDELLKPPIGGVGDTAAANVDLRRTRVVLWLSTPLFTGAVIMALELVAFRLYAPYFGYSIYVWGSMISVVMLALASGYALGGWVADRSQNDISLYCMLLGSALYQLCILLTVHSMLPAFARMGDFVGTAVASLVVFAPPMTATATACPFLIRLLAHSGRIGSVAGKIYALSTIGGIAGILSTSFFLVPRLGTHTTLETICLLSAVIAAAGLVLHLRAAIIALGFIGAALLLVPPPTWPGSTVWAVESAYNLVRVVRNGNLLLLKLNDEGGVHTILDQRTGWTGHYYDDFALGPMLVPAKRLLVLGLGGGGSIGYTRMTAPQIDVDAVEIDPAVVEAATRFFGLNAPDAKLHIYVADARPWLRENQGSYDLVHVDLYQGGPYIPFYLVTVEFFKAVRAHISPDGLMMMNLFDVSVTQELLMSTVATLERVYPTVVVLSVGYGNHMLLAFSKETSIASIRAQLENFAGNRAVERLAKRAEAQITDREVPGDTIVFTDDFAPVEEITRRMLKGN